MLCVGADPKTLSTQCWLINNAAVKPTPENNFYTFFFLSFCALIIKNKINKIFDWLCTHKSSHPSSVFIDESTECSLSYSGVWRCPAACIWWPTASHALLFLNAVSPHCMNQPHEPGQSRDCSAMLSSTPQPGVGLYPAFQAAGQCRTYSPSNISTEVSHLTEISLRRKISTLISLINPIKQQMCLFLYLRNSAISSRECHSITRFAVTWTLQDENCLPSKAVIFPHCNS